MNSSTALLYPTTHPAALPFPGGPGADWRSTWSGQPGWFLRLPWPWDHYLSLTPLDPTHLLHTHLPQPAHSFPHTHGSSHTAHTALPLFIPPHTPSFLDYPFTLGPRDYHSFHTRCAAMSTSSLLRVPTPLPHTLPATACGVAR